MSELADLLAQRLSSPADEQERVNRGFERAVRAGPLGLRGPNGAVRPSGLHLVVGVMPSWNAYDRQLVLILEQAASALDPESEHIEVFNADAVQSSTELDALIPGAGRYMQAPFLGVWRDGELWICDSGASATTWLLDRYGTPT